MVMSCLIGISIITPVILTFTSTTTTTAVNYPRNYSNDGKASSSYGSSGRQTQRAKYSRRTPPQGPRTDDRLITTLNKHGHHSATTANKAAAVT